MTTQDSQHKTCPTCGARLDADAPRCTVCGRVFHSDQDKKEKKNKPSKDPSSDVRAQRMPEVSLSLPVAIAIVILAFVIGAGLFFLVLREQDVIVESTMTVTPSQTATITVTPTNTLTPTPEPTWTPLPPIEYTVQTGDYCGTIAFLFDVSVQSIILENDLPADCAGLIVGQTLLIPQPTPTPSPAPTNTLSPAEATEQACEKVKYTVESGQTLSYIADLYDVSIETIKNANSMTNDSVLQGQVLEIPLCERLPTPGPTPTATLPPPYYAPQLLLPRDGEAFMKMTDTITLQWESVGALRSNEAYAVTIEDVTAGDGTKLTAYVDDTKYIVPDGLRPTDNIPHIFRWWVVPVRQVGSTDEGEPVWDSAGDLGEAHVFSWWGIGE
ncbi:MAG: LysM peptidoglycan-binding domain-containing protein [Anaerolineae bacterium]|jgi:LysM repeat protein|nr:LysM peptidoglycan-binding domain-containing protein [Anaerolineae bacterium]